MNFCLTICSPVHPVQFQIFSDDLKHPFSIWMLRKITGTVRSSTEHLPLLYNQSVGILNKDSNLAPLKGSFSNYRFDVIECIFYFSGSFLLGGFTLFLLLSKLGKRLARSYEEKRETDTSLTA